MEKTILKKLNELEYHYTLLEEEVKMNYDTRNILNLIHETRSLVEKLTIPNVSNMLTVKEVLDILDDSDHLDDAKTLIRETVS
jgi:hypothetical protein